MWNSLKSDLYRVFHMRAFYITLCIGVVMSSILITSTGFTMSSPFSNFSRETDSLVDFLVYITKSPLFAILLLVFLSVFHNDEYDKGYAKNILPIHFKKSSIVIERYILGIIVSIVLLLSMFLAGGIATCFVPLASESFKVLDLVIFVTVQILLINTVVSFLMMLNHITRSKVIVILVACVFSMLILYMLEVSIASWLLGDAEILKYTIYQQIGTLPTTFTWESYQLAFFVLIGNTVLYNVISFIALKKKDL